MSTFENSNADRGKNASSMPELNVLLDGLAYVESPRWHEGRLWFAHWGTGEIVAVDPFGNSEVTGHGPAGLGWAIDWLPDGRLLVTGKELLCREPDGSMVRHADLSGVADFWNEIVVDGRGNIYLNSIRFGFLAGQPPTSGIIALVTPDGSVRQVADDLAFPNGMVITPDNSTLIISESFTGRLIAFDIESDGSLSNQRVWAEGLGPDGICMDAEGAVWVQTGDTRAHTGRSDAPEGAVVRVREGSEVLQRIEYDRAIFAAMLGGPDRTTLFLLAAEWRGIEQVNEAVAARTGQVLVSQVSVPGAGWP
ncbi:MAG TPA: SMP-30/gluconolactonase/LRE family protein [Ktedonobacteraceae bacterium]|jgi:sugar lactone lactonase YvrE|nr:SMP-30/gluconolactonase/LRE family protein [Ktedonobacteraceae bacterium]